MRVPVKRTPDTQIAPQTRGYQRASQAIDFAPITNTIRQFGKDIDDSRKELEDIEFSKIVIAETNRLNTDFQDRLRTKPPEGFAQGTLDDYEQQHVTVLDGLYEEGRFSQEGLEKLASRLGALRVPFGERALVHQYGAARAQSGADIEELTVGVSQMVTQDFTAYGSGLVELDTAIDADPRLTPEEKLQKKGEARRIVRSSAAKGGALMDPDYFIEKLDPKGLMAPVEPTAATINGAPISGAYANVRGFQAVPVTVANELGLDPEDVAAVMSFETGGTMDPAEWGGDGDRYLGLIQFGPEEQATYGITPSSTPEQWSAAVIKFMSDRGFEKGMGIEDFYSTILTGSPGNYDRQDSNGTSVRNAVPRILAEHKPKAVEWLQRGAAPMDDASASNAEDTPAVVEIDPDTGEPVIREPSETEPAPEQTFSIANSKTGDPLLDDMTGEERLQALAWAYEQRSKKTVSLKSSMDVVISNMAASINSPDGYAGPMVTREQLVQVYGPVEAEQKWAQGPGALQTGDIIRRLGTKSEAQIAVEVEKLRPAPNSPTLAVDNQLYQAAIRAQDEIVRRRAADPAAYVFQTYPNIASQMANAKTPEDRKAAYLAMERAFEQLGTPEKDRVYFTKGMMREFEGQYKLASSEQKFELINQTLMEMSPERAGRFLNRAGGDRSSSKVADDLALYAMLQTQPNFRGVFTRVLQGREAIEKDPSRRVSSAAVNKVYLAELGGAIAKLPPETSNVINQAAEALYVERDGRMNGTMLADQKLYEQGLREALGGVGSDTNTGYFTNGSMEATILPPGIKKQQFQNWVEGLTNTDFARMSGGKQPRDSRGQIIPLYKVLEEGVFIMRAPGVYGIKLNSDKKFVGDGTGVLELRIDPRMVR